MTSALETRAQLGCKCAIWGKRDLLLRIYDQARPLEQKSGLCVCVCVFNGSPDGALTLSLRLSPGRRASNCRRWRQRRLVMEQPGDGRNQTLLRMRFGSLATFHLEHLTALYRRYLIRLPEASRRNMHHRLHWRGCLGKEECSWTNYFVSSPFTRAHTAIPQSKQGSKLLLSREVYSLAGTRRSSHKLFLPVLRLTQGSLRGENPGEG